ncbi:MAG: bifunctional (p)ppGpp synthetase/guanosine-3',5'-bis(diphosphate) 3'-pyrophosphohydrolase [Chloroflexota bacterium]|nr:bifunctional (p)ppGpp synthetase/guanosine-3',5'-bis(diphosphate) 3'-pyrophosphohydrolase [Dehalococcoidia bacterium]MDW8252866.1 bifunctional (p)ppGpp synthetase/guanosine-3',5'-bis(diphosphate) 3'-pyrophosphohydrolase [Chloroflexota bacterium]
MSFELLRSRALQYLPPGSIEIIDRAYQFAAVAHDGQRRKSGEPYLEHPVAAALILTELHLDQNAIAAAILHDVPEDCGVPIEEIEQRFGREVASLVDGVTKLSKVTSFAHDTRGSAKAGEEVAQAENLRKMLIAMAEDVRVVLIKLADRLHNMRTLWALPPARQRAIAQETMEIFAPLAGRLGIYQVKSELEDLAFSYLEPEKYREIADLVAKRRAAGEQYLSRVIQKLRRALEEATIKGEVSGRTKHLYSVYRKMRAYETIGRQFDDIYDLLAVRVLVDTVPECYHALGVVHTLWHPVPGQFDDYIANPKQSMYQSLHTTVIAEEGKPLEIQIRTHEMHRVAEYGIAAHWRYKEGNRKPDIKFEERVAWLRQLLEWQKEVRGAQEFVDSVKTDLFRDQVFVYTPRGEIKDLPAGATPLDFAYRIHTDLGHRCVGAKVNGRLVPLNTPLKNGDQVEIIAPKSSRGPSRDWLNPNLGYVKTSHAREKIRQWFRRQERAENLERGRELLEKELKRLAIQKPLEEIAKLFKYDKLEDFLVAIGVGEINPGQIAVKIAAAEPRPMTLPVTPKRDGSAPNGGIAVMGVGDLVTTIARCCSPVPGDVIVGYITRFRGVTVHRADCPNLRNLAEPERIVRVDWALSKDHVFPARIRVDAWDRVGLLSDVTAVIAAENINMSAVHTESNPDGTATISMKLDTTGIEQLSRVLGKLEAVKGIITVSRETG